MIIWALPREKAGSVHPLLSFCSYLSKRITASAPNAASRCKKVCNLWGEYFNSL
jgi:hypothetical protein